jgi:hypothetical protein
MPKALQATHCSYQLQPSAHCALCVVLMGLGVSQVHEHSIAHVLRYEAAEALHDLRDTLLVGRDDLPEVFRVHAGRKGRRANQVREHYSDLTPLGGFLWCNG